jgi:hypothetical protein
VLLFINVAVWQTQLSHKHPYNTLQPQKNSTIADQAVAIWQHPAPTGKSPPPLNIQTKLTTDTTNVLIGLFIGWWHNFK